MSGKPGVERKKEEKACEDASHPFFEHSITIFKQPPIHFVLFFSHTLILRAYVS
jgi:hypothetical protein